MTPPDTADRSPQTYDFSRPNVLSAEFAGHFASWQEALCAMLRERWPQFAPGQINLAGPQLEALSFATVRQRMPRPAVAYVVRMADASWASLVVVQRQVALAIVLEMLDESGDGLPEDRILSEVEQSLTELFFQEFTALLGQSWPDRHTLTCELGQFDPQPHYSRLWDTSEIVLSCRYELQGRSGALPLWWIAPQRAVESQLATLAHVDRQSATNQWRESIQRHAVNLPVTLTVILGQTELNVSQLAALQVGDVIPLRQRIDEPLAIEVGQQVKFLAWPGRRGPRLAVQIDSLT